MWSCSDGLGGQQLSMAQTLLLITLLHICIFSESAVINIENFQQLTFYNFYKNIIVFLILICSTVFHMKILLKKIMYMLK